MTLDLLIRNATLPDGRKGLDIAARFDPRGDRGMYVAASLTECPRGERRRRGEA